MEDKIVSVDTDNLDDFSALLTGKATAAPEEVKPEAAVETVEEVVQPDPEDNSLAEPAEEVTEVVEDEKTLFVPKKKTVQERINELTAKAKEAERREADALRELQELRAAKEVKKTEEVPVVAVGAPTPDDLLENGELKYPLGEYDPAFLRDQMKHLFAEERAQAAIEDAKAREEADKASKLSEVEAQRAALKADWADRVTETVTAVPDFVEKVQTLEATFTNLDPGYGEYLATTIMSMENGTDVLYHLSNNLEEAQRIAALGPVQATIALGRIEARFADADNGNVRAVKVSRAPEPPPSVNKGHKATTDISDDTNDLDAFAKKFFKK